MKAFLRTAALLLASFAMVVGATVSPASAVDEQAQYYVTTYDGTVWEVTASTIRALSFSQWQAAGFPTPVEAQTQYVKYPWSSTVSAVTFYGSTRDRWVWKHVTSAEWARAGFPTPRHAGWIEGSTYYQWAGSSQVFVKDVGGVKHALSFAEWQAAGQPSFSRIANQGFVKLSWDGSIAFLSDVASGVGAPIGYERWRSEGFPQPTVAARFPGDKVYRFNGESTVWYAGPTVNRAINGNEWAAMGYPTPTIEHIRAVAGTWDCPSYAPIKGNADSGIYHVPGQRYYSSTNPEECFRTESAAVNAGYRKAKV